MIKVERSAIPSILEVNALAWKAELLDAIAELNKNPKDTAAKRRKKLAEGKYRHSSVQGALSKMFSRKCAYCEAKMEHISYPHIDHFRPKFSFPELCFSWDNLMWACGVCNGAEYKGEHFPNAANGGPLVSPVTDKIETHLEFEYDTSTGTANVNPISIRGKTTESTLGLNRTTLVKHRSSVVKLIAFAGVKAKLGDTKGRELFVISCQKSSEYAAFARSLAIQLGIKWK